MRSATQLREAADAQVPASDYVPFGTHVAPNVIKLKRTGDYVITWRLEGISFETADPQDILVRKEGLVNLLRALGGGQWAIWSHKVRRRVRERLTGKYDIDLCRELNERYYAGFDARDPITQRELHRQMATELYLTIIYRPAPSMTARLFKRLSRTVQEIKERQTEDLTVIEDMASQVEASLRKYEPERLGTFTRKDVVFSEMLSFFGFLTNGVWEDVPLQRQNLADYLPTSRLHFGDKNGMLEIWHPAAEGGKKFVGFLDFQEYPEHSEPGMNNGILYGDYEYVETQSFSIMNKRDAIDALERQRNQLIASEDAADGQIADMKQAQEDLASGKIEMGEYHFTLAVFGESLSAVAKSMAEARSVLQDGPGYKLAVVDAIPECAWFAQLPGNWKLRPREATISSRNFACLSPFHNFARGKRDGNPWGEAIALFKTPSGQPFYFNFHTSPDDEDSTDKKLPGNTFICGATGSGKTVSQMALLMFTTKVPNFRFVAFDKDRGMEIAIRAMRGKYRALKRGEPTGFNPFQWELTESNIQFCEKLVKRLVCSNGEPLSARDEDDVSHAVRTVMNAEFPAEFRRLGAVDQNLPSTGENSLRMRLKKWVGSGPLAWVFDNPRDVLDLSGARAYGFDYTEFLEDDEVRTPIMMYLLRATQSLINGQPMAFVMEEFWRPLRDEIFSDFALNKNKTIRKESGLGIYVTQSPADVLHAGGVLSKAIVEQSVTQIYLPNPRADHDDYVNGFKVTEQEFQIIKSLGETSRMMLIKQGHRSAVVKFDLGAMPDLLNIISGSIDNVELLDDVRNELQTDDPDVWIPELQRRIANRVKRVAR